MQHEVDSLLPSKQIPVSATSRQKVCPVCEHSHAALDQPRVLSQHIQATSLVITITHLKCPVSSSFLTAAYKQTSFGPSCAQTAEGAVPEDLCLFLKLPVGTRW